MVIQFSDKSYRKGYVKNPIYSYAYELKENVEMQSINNPEEGKLEMTSLTYYYASKLVEKDGTVSIPSKVTVPITDGIRKIIVNAKNADEERIKKQRKRNEENGKDCYDFPEVSMEGMELTSEKNPIDSLMEYADLHSAIGKLNKEQREVIRLRYFKGMRQKEAAEILNVGVPAISRMEKRAINELRKILAQG